MPSYAVLGATGNCGTALIDNLLRREDVKINAYCRNKKKLIDSVPAIDNNKRVEVFAGSIQDQELLAKCIRGTAAIFHVVTTNTNIPGCNVGFETASSIIAALQKIKSESPNTRVPKVVLLSSATIDDYLARKMPWPFRPIMLTAASFMYDDLRRTEALLREQENWISSIFIKPGGLSADKQRGHKLDFDNEESFISFLDLAAAMIEAADDPSGQYDMKNVSVVNTGGSARMPPGTPMCIVLGLIRHFVPFLHPYLPTPGPG